MKNKKVSGKVSQRNLIKNHLLSGKSLTALTALKKYGSFRLAAVIWRLKKKDKLNIQTEFQSKGGKHYAVYSLGSSKLTA